MSLSSHLTRRFALLGLTAALAGCGFAPVYGTNGSAEALRGQVLVAEPNDRDSYVLTRRVEERLGRTEVSRFGLSVSLNSNDISIAITQDGEITRYNVTGSADFAVTDLTTGALISSGTVNSFTSYSATGTTVATLSAEQDARDRLSVALADLIVTRLIATAPAS